MKKLLVCLLLPLLSMAAQQKEAKLFPYDYAIDDLDNGLRLVTIPTDFPNMVALYIVVQAGSRNEVEPGKSGYAHLFEHLMFRGSENYTPADRDLILKKAGAETNASTNSDRTTYYDVFSKDDLDAVMKLEADRFQHLQYSESAYKTESLAVLGEYNKDSADPTEKLDEALRAAAFKQHTYAHTTMGFLKDIQDMPNQYAYSLEFYRRFYRARSSVRTDEEVFRRLETRRLSSRDPRRTRANRAAYCGGAVEFADASVGCDRIQRSCVFG
jgi:zinc protease